MAYTCTACGKYNLGTTPNGKCPLCNPFTGLAPTTQAGTTRLSCPSGHAFDGRDTDPTPECPECGQRVHRKFTPNADVQRKPYTSPTLRAVDPSTSPFSVDFEAGRAALLRQLHLMSGELRQEGELLTPDAYMALEYVQTDARKQERASVTAWLRGQLPADDRIRRLFEALAAEIERGDHLHPAKEVT